MLFLFSGAGGTSTRAEQYGHRPDFWISQVSTHSFCKKNIKVNEDWTKNTCRNRGLHGIHARSSAT